MGRRALLGVLALILAALAAASIWSALAEVDQQGPTALHVGAEHVLIAVDHEVLVTDLQGRLLGELRDATGGPRRFADVVALQQSPSGELHVVDIGTREILRFPTWTEPGERWLPLDSEGWAFELLETPKGILFADTIGHRLKLLSKEGQPVHSSKVTYPNGLSLLCEDRSLLSGKCNDWTYALAETGSIRMRALDARLQPKSSRLVSAVNDLLEGGHRAPRGPHLDTSYDELLDATSGPADSLWFSYCTTVNGDCAVLRAALRGESEKQVTTDVVAHLGVVQDADATDLDLPLVAELGVTPSGTLLVLSSRLSGVYAFSGADGPLPGGFCSSCDEDELASLAVPRSALSSPHRFPNGAQLAAFGDAAVQARLSRAHLRRAELRQYQTWSQRGALLTLLLLGLTWMLLRQARGYATVPDEQPAIGTLWVKLIRPDLPALLVALSWMLLGVTLGALGGRLALGNSGGFAGAAVLGLWFTRNRAVPGLLRRRSPSLAPTAFALFWRAGPTGTSLTLGDDEQPLWSAYALRTPEAPSSLWQRVRAGRELLQLDDVLELLERLLPRLLLITLTSERVLIGQCSMLGAPIGAWTSYPLEAPAPSGTTPRELVVSPDGAQDLRFALASTGGDVLRLACRGPTVHCVSCRRPLALCPHLRRPSRLLLALTVLFPGLGHVVQRRLGAARLNVLVALGFLLEAVHVFLPQWRGALPWEPVLFALPLAAYLGTGVMAAVDVWAAPRRQLRSPLVSTRPSGPSAQGEY